MISGLMNNFRQFRQSNRSRHTAPGALTLLLLQQLSTKLLYWSLINASENFLTEFEHLYQLL